MPPAPSMSSKASAAEGTPPTRWAMPEPATVAMSRPMMMRPLARWSVAWRKQRTATTSRAIGTRRANHPTVPPTTPCTTRPTAVPRRPHHSTAAISAASSSRSRPVPSRRSSRSMRTSGPSLRKPAPTGVANPIHRVCRARRGAAGRSASGTVAVDPFRPEPRRPAEPERDVAEEEDDECVGEVRVAMPTKLPRTADTAGMATRRGQASRTTGMIIGRRRSLRLTHVPTVRRTTC